MPHMDKHKETRVMKPIHLITPRFFELIIQTKYLLFILHNNIFHFFFKLIKLNVLAISQPITEMLDSCPSSMLADSQTDLRVPLHPLRWVPGDNI